MVFTRRYFGSFWLAKTLERSFKTSESASVSWLSVEMACSSGVMRGDLMTFRVQKLPSALRRAAARAVLVLTSQPAEAPPVVPRMSIYQPCEINVFYLAVGRAHRAAPIRLASLEITFVDVDHWHVDSVPRPSDLPSLKSPS